MGCSSDGARLHGFVVLVAGIDAETRRGWLQSPVLALAAARLCSTSQPGTALWDMHLRVPHLTDHYQPGTAREVGWSLKASNRQLSRTR